MSPLDDLPNVESFFGVDLRTGSLIVAVIGVIHPMVYGCSCFTPISYLIVTIWILVALFFAASIALYSGIVNDDALLCAIWIWYALIFVVIMLMMMIMLALLFTSRRQRSRVFIAILGMLWYILTIYFILVVNSYRKTINNKEGMIVLMTTSSTPSPTTTTDQPDQLNKPDIDKDHKYAVDNSVDTKAVCIVHHQISARLTILIIEDLYGKA
ncbi:unnamed protein product [Spodoptera exigua]|nr:unnamed protein product [Spodoptera exigua]